MKCPRCKRTGVEVLWESVLFCSSCHSTSIKGEKRYILSCKEDRSPLVPRRKYPTPTLVCPKCGKEYCPPVGSNPEVLEGDLD